MKTLVILLAAFAAGCDPVSVSALTVAPPGKVAQLDDEVLELTVSKGIALAFECTASTTDYDGPCRNARAKMNDSAVASVYASYLDTLVDTWNDGYAGQQARVAFVVVGLAAGTAELELVTTDGDIDVAVTVVP